MTHTCCQTTYPAVRDFMRPFDLLAFGGKGRFSNLIKWGTHSAVSHVALILETKVAYDDQAQDGKVVMIIESTTLSADKKSGVQIRRLSEVLANYSGEVWWLPLANDVRARLDLKAAGDFALCQWHKPYDMVQAIFSALPFKQPESYAKLFCSELAAGTYKAGGIIERGVNPAEISPIELCKIPLFASTYWQIKGKLKGIGI